MRILDSRRLTGKNFLSPRAGAVAEVRFDSGENPEAAVLAWSAALDRVLSLFETRLRGDGPAPA